MGNIEKIIREGLKPRSNALYKTDCRSRIYFILDESIDCVISDIPYGISLEAWDVLHNNTNKAHLGKSPAQANKEIFKSRGKPLNGWSKADKLIPYEYEDWCRTWVPDLYRILKPGSSCIVFAGRRLAHRFINVMEDSGFILKDQLAWIRSQAAHRAQNVSEIIKRRNLESSKWDGWKVGNLRPVFEPILWFMKPYSKTLIDTILTHNLGAYNEDLFINHQGNANNIIQSQSSKKDRGLHPAQKPLLLMETLVELVTVKGQVVLDPFMGSGTTCLAAKNKRRSYIGFEMNTKFFNIAQERLNG